MKIKLNRAYVSHYDNIEYPIFKLSDGSYLCIAYSNSHDCYFINTYTKEKFIEQGFSKDKYYDCDELFWNLTKEDIIGL